MKQNVEETTQIPEGVTVTIYDKMMIVKGPKGEVKRPKPLARVDIKTDGKTLTLTSKKATKREKAQLYTTLAHLKNAMKGVKEPYKYVLKICSGHFPMNVSVTVGNLAVKNFLGEKFPRTMPIKQGATITIQGDKITVESPNIEAAGQTASEIELLTRISKRDTRVFQDGIYIIEKPGIQK